MQQDVRIHNSLTTQPHYGSYGERWRIPLATMTSAPVSEMPPAGVLEAGADVGTSRRGGIFTIHATRNDQSMVTHRIIPDVAVAQARVLNDAGWRVRISGLGGRQFAPSEFHQLLTFDRIG